MINTNVYAVAMGISHSRRYMNGASTNPDAHVVAHAAAQVKKGLEIAKKLDSENFGWYGNGTSTVLNFERNHNDLYIMSSLMYVVIDMC